MKNATIFRLRFNRKYTTFIPTSHGTVCVEFNPIVLFSRVENSQYSTNDPEVIEALKKSCDYGSLFYLEEEGREVSKKTDEAEDLQQRREPKHQEKEGAASAAAGDGRQEPGGTDAPEKAETTAGDEQQEQVGTDAPAKTEASTEEDGDEYIHETTVTSKNKAIAYLMAQFGAKFSQTTDIPAMKEEAKATYKVVFDSWK